jgi:hypothetical protein
MLSVNKPLMDTKFSMLVKKGTAKMPDSGGAIYKAAYHAYFDKTYDRLMETSDPSDTDLYDDLRSKKMLKSDNIDKLRDDAHDFASLFADAMDEILKEVSSQVDAHVKALANGMTITMLPQGIATVVSPMGPCTGSMVIKNGATASIIIS